MRSDWLAGEMRRGIPADRTTPAPRRPQIRQFHSQTTLDTQFFNRIPALDFRPDSTATISASGTGSARGDGNTGAAISAPDINKTRKAARRRFLKRFRERWHARRERRYEAKAKRTTTQRKRRRKRTALALGATSLSLTSASHLALSADAIWASNSGDYISVPIVQETPDPTERRDASDLSVSDELLEAMVEEEGVRYRVYRDVAGYPTVGVGHLVLPKDNLRIGDRISHERAMQLLEQDLRKAEQGVRNLVGDLPVNQNEFDALVDLVFNVGEGNVSKLKSPRLNAAIAAGDYERIAEELEYTTAKNKVARGLVYRSERRAQIFMDADYSDPREG